MENKTEYIELIGFLSDKNRVVQAQAVTILEQYSGEPDRVLVDLIASDADLIVRPHLRLVESE